MNGEFSCKDIYLGFPDMLVKNGVERIIKLELAPEDKERVEVSRNEVRTSLDMLLSY